MKTVRFRLSAYALPPRALVVVALLTFGALSTSAQSSPVYPGDQWERIERPDTAGWSVEGLSKVREKLRTMSSTGLMAIVGGRVLFEYGDVQRVSYLASARKSVLSMLYGVAVDAGKVRLDQTLAELGIDDLGGLSAQEKQATVRDLLTARSGVYHPASNEGDDSALAPARGSQPHGTYFLYNNWDFNAAGTAFEKATGRTIYDALEEDLVRPLNMQDFDRSLHNKTGDLSRSIHPAYHIHLSTRDMARLGYLMLRRGNWRGRQLISRRWIDESTTAHTRVGEMNPPRRREGPWGYGYLWWIWEGKHNTGPYLGAFTAHGAVGQHIAVLPALDLVVAHKTEPGDRRLVTHPQFLEVLDLIVNVRQPR